MDSQKLSKEDWAWLDLDLSVHAPASEEPRNLRLRTKRAFPPLPTKAGRPRVSNGPGPADGLDKPSDPAIELVRQALLQADPDGSRIAFALREALDQVYDGRRTGRWDFTQLSKTEKTHIGTLVEIWLQREFEFDDGLDLDFSIAGVDVDCKWSRNLYGWEIPMEMYSRGHKIAMLIWGNEDSARWALGLLRISEDMLKPLGGQRDRKRQLSDLGRANITWVYRSATMIRNALVHHPATAIKMRDARSGQEAVRTIFREIQGELINHATIETAGQQVDSSKRVRDARKALRNEGLIILGHYDPHPRIAEELGLPRPTLGRFVAVRVARCSEVDAGPSAGIGGQRWRVATADDAPQPAPILPKQGKG
ncbi:NaeI family type II restriction endonuclease [Dietzia sp. 111N12-1]|uniref:NaeI family type II restriction endonuclease n=1 Tax=Dietzia sp. 111N12-1 TaxID=1785156 RepID=UPI0009EDB80E|nr:NaeI family type II restriction endonuclease [Dietzia sp. 111N12-1]